MSIFKNLTPNSLEHEKKHREKKRKQEIKKTISYLKEYLPNEKIKILEFGSGKGYQIPQLQKLGEVIASDVNIPSKTRYSRYIACDIQHPPFSPQTFQLIFSNHVLEHVELLENTLQSIKKLGTKNCIFAFTMPTRFWLLLTIPAHYYNIFKHLTDYRDKTQDNPDDQKSRADSMSIFEKLKYIIPGGHPVHKKFLKCFKKFGSSAWKQKFKKAGFKIITTKPLLTYGPSEWPIISTQNSPANTLTSSRLYILKKVK